jgi:hypothetical protein
LRGVRLVLVVSLCLCLPCLFPIWPGPAARIAEVQVMLRANGGCRRARRGLGKSR